MLQSVKEKIKASVAQSARQVFLRKDFEHMGGYRQVSRALTDLEHEAVLRRSGRGIYTRASLQSLGDVQGVVHAIRERLPGPRIKRSVTVGNTTVLLDRKTPSPSISRAAKVRPLALAPTTVSAAVGAIGAGAVEVQRKSKRLGLSFPYDWSNPDIRDDALILNVLERGIFKDIARVCAWFGIEKVEQLVPALPPEIAHSDWLARMLNNIKQGFLNAQAR